MVMDGIKEHAVRPRNSVDTVLYVISRVDRLLPHPDDRRYCFSKDTHVADDAMAPSLVTTLLGPDDALIPVLPSPYSSGRVIAWPRPGC